MVSLYIVDDHPISRWGLQRALESQGDIRVTGAFESAEGLKEGWSQQFPPELIVLDLYLADDLPCVGLLADLTVRTPVLVVSASRRVGEAAVCRRAGASGFAYKGSDAETLVMAVRSIHRGATFFPENQEIESALSGLSPRERQVLAYIASGYTHDQAARRLGVSRHTVDTYLKRLRVKIGDGNKAHLTRMAMLANVSLDASQN